MRHILWLNDCPIIPTLHTCSAQWLIDRFSSSLHLVDEDDLSPLILKALEVADTLLPRRSASMRMTPAVKLYWRTRLQPEYVPLAQLKIMVPKLTLNGTPLDSSIIDKTVYCSDRRHL